MPAARAQYSVTYSGGQYTLNGGSPANDGPVTGAVFPVTGAVFPGSWGVNVGVKAQGGGGDPQIVRAGGQGPKSVRSGPRPMLTDPNSDSLDASGAITATVHWGGTDPPPAVAIEEEDCAVSWSGGAGTSGSCTCPLGGTLVTLSPGQSCRFSKFTVLSGQSDITASCEPKASATVPHYVGGAIAVEYRVSVTPVTVGLGGVMVDPNDKKLKALTGQQITASLAGLPTTAVVSSYTWTVGGDTFKTYDTSKTNNDQLVRLTAADKTGPPTGQTTMGGLTFYDKTAEPLTVSCNATFSVPNGGSATVNPSSQQFTVLKPTATWTVATGNDPHVYNHPSAKNFGPNVGWQLNISVPAPFSGGIGCIGQIVTTHRTNVLDPGTGNQIVYTTKDPGPGLDKDFPYQFGFPLDANGDPDESHPITTRYTWVVSNTGYSGDQPLQPYLGNDAHYSDDKWVKSTADDTFDTYLMYQPGATNSVWIPLQKIHWDWKATVTITPQATPISGTSFFSDQTGTLTNDPPQWSEVVVGTVTQP